MSSCRAPAGWIRPARLRIGTLVRAEEHRDEPLRQVAAVGESVRRDPREHRDEPLRDGAVVPELVTWAPRHRRDESFGDVSAVREAVREPLRKHPRPPARPVASVREAIPGRRNEHDRHPLGHGASLLGLDRLGEAGERLLVEHAGSGNSRTHEREGSEEEEWESSRHQKLKS